jgi:hypothetical protein
VLSPSDVTFPIAHAAQIKRERPVEVHGRNGAIEIVAK